MLYHRAGTPIRLLLFWAAAMIRTRYKTGSHNALWSMLPVVAMTIASAHAQHEQVQPSGQMDVVRLVDLAAQRLKLNVDYDATALKAAGQVALRLDSAMTDQELWTLTNRILIARGFVTVRVGGTSAYSVVKIADAPAMAGIANSITEEAAAATAGPMPGYRVQAVHLRHRSGKDMVEAVAKVLSKPGGAAVVIKESPESVILISDVSSRVDQAVALIGLLDTPPDPGIVEEVAIHNYSAQQLIPIATQIASKRSAGNGDSGDLMASPDGASIFLVCSRDRAEYWRELISRLDQRPAIESVAYSSSSVSPRDLAGLVQRSLPEAEGPPGGPTAKISVDEQAGTVTVTGSPVVHERVRALIGRLDAAPAAAHRTMRSFTIRNRPVRDVQAVVMQLVQSGALTSEAEATDGSTATDDDSGGGAAPWPPPAAPMSSIGGVQSMAPHTKSSPQAVVDSRSVRRPSNVSPQDRTGYLPGSQPRRGIPDFTLASDEGTNTLIAMGDSPFLSQLSTLITSLDVRQPQVMLEVLIVSLSESQTLDLGVELEKLGGTGDTKTRVSSLFGLSTRDAAGNVTAGNGIGLTGVVLNPGDFSVVLRALATLNKGRSLSMPRLLVTNNQQATLDSVLEQPYASTNASNTVTTTSFGGSKPAGTQITLKPQITGGAGGGEGDHLLLEYSVSLSAFIGAAASGSVPPPRQENKVQSVASLPDGHTVVVGGIELTTDGKATNQVPGFGNIPVLGELFKSRSNNASRSRFYVFIRANVLRARGFEDLKYMSEVMTPQVGIADGWPVVEPRVIR